MIIKEPSTPMIQPITNTMTSVGINGENTPLKKSDSVTELCGTREEISVGRDELSILSKAINTFVLFTRYKYENEVK